MAHGKHARVPSGSGRAGAIALFVVVAGLWLVLDRATKLWANASANPGDVLVDNVAQLFEFRLVHNTGAAWGIFADSTFALGVFSLVVCILILVLVFFIVRRSGSKLQVFALALVFAGGLGNAVDRLTLGYVVDFINTTFINFPVFNVADIGVTCGIALFVVAYLLAARTETKGA